MNTHCSHLLAQQWALHVTEQSCAHLMDEHNFIYCSCEVGIRHIPNIL